jgi:hypothetical protein
MDKQRVKVLRIISLIVFVVVCAITIPLVAHKKSETLHSKQMPPLSQIERQNVIVVATVVPATPQTSTKPVALPVKVEKERAATHRVAVNERIPSQITNEIEKSISGPLPQKGGWSLVDSMAAQPEREGSMPEQFIVAKQNGYIFFKQEVSSIKNFSDTEGLPVVYNPDRHTLGIVTGNYIVRFKNKNESPEDLANSYRLTVQDSFPHLKMAVMRAQNGDDLMVVLGKLKNDTRVNTVELEIITNSERKL